MASLLLFQAAGVELIDSQKDLSVWAECAVTERDHLLLGQHLEHVESCSESCCKHRQVSNHSSQSCAERTVGFN